ncbi:hypothetical protein [Microbacterium tumbae]
MAEERAVTTGGLRRDMRESAPASELPAAPPVRSARSGTRRVGGGWPVWAGAIAAVLGITVITAAALMPQGGGDSPTQVVAAAAQPAEDAKPTIPCPAFAGGEASSSTRSAACGRPRLADSETDPAVDAESGTPGSEGRESSSSSDPGTTEQDRGRSGTDSPGTDAPGTSAPGTDAPGTSGPGPSDPGGSDPGDPDPGTSNPGTGTPTTPPVTTPSNPPVTTPSNPPAATPAALAFTGKKTNSLLGTGLLSSYTLSLSGEPGSTVTVWYGSVKAGSRTFDSSGKTSITLGLSLINLGLSNPTIRAAYSDGTAGAEISAPLKSI